MKRTSKAVGVTGAVMIATGLVMAWAAFVISQGNPALAMVVFLSSSFLYIMGGLLAVSHFNYQRGSSTYLLIAFGRLAYAAAAVLTMVRVAGG